MSPAELDAMIPGNAHDWNVEARRRWPDGLDMIEAVVGTGQWATVSWCGHVLVIVHPTLESAQTAMTIMRGGCGHACWNDHELVDLAEPEHLDVEAEWLRGPQRAAHMRSCPSCRDFTRGRGPAAAMHRAHDRRRRGLIA